MHVSAFITLFLCVRAYPFGIVAAGVYELSLNITGCTILVLSVAHAGVSGLQRYSYLYLFSVILCSKHTATSMFPSPSNQRLENVLSTSVRVGVLAEKERERAREREREREKEYVEREGEREKGPTEGY